ncbi:TPA: hypothetical protein ACGCNR_001544 [Stenotrophomonas maltophilia]
MKTNDKTLADAQPGGRVRLGDGLVLAKLVGAAGLMLAEIDTCGHEVDPAYRRTLYEAWEEGKAALSAQPSLGAQAAHCPVKHCGMTYARVPADGRCHACGASVQPSPGGQGDAITLAAEAIDDLHEEMTGARIGDEVSRQFAEAAINAALAARQPVGEPMRSDLSGYAVTASQVRRGYDVECDRCGKFCDEGPGPCQPVGEPVLYQMRRHLPPNGWTEGNPKMHARIESWSDITKEHYDIYVSVMGGCGPAGVIGNPLGPVALEPNPYGRKMEVRALYAAPPAQGWVVADGQGERWRMWGSYGPEWTSDRDQALHFARRADAEAFANDDEDAWLIQAVPHG